MSSKEAIKSVSVIGLGNFGRFVVSLIPPDQGVDVMGYDVKKTELAPRVSIVSLGEAALADVIILAVPLRSYEAVLPPLAELISKDSLLVDVCSVKIKPEELIKRYLPRHPNLLLTHPQFGPRSATNGLAGHRVAVTKAKGKKANMVLAWCKDLGLDIWQVSAKKHDQYMETHALTLFVAMALKDMGLEREAKFSTPSSQMIRDLAEFAKTSSPDLVDTILNGNPFASAVCREFLARLHQIDDQYAERQTLG